jgi:hypothetical protein
MLTLSFVIHDPKQTSRPRSEALGIPARRDVMIAGSTRAIVLIGRQMTRDEKGQAVSAIASAGHCQELL